MSRWHKFDHPDLPERAFQPRCGKFGSMTLEGGGGSRPDPQIGQANLQQVQLSREMWDDYKTNDRPWLQDTANKAIDSFLQTQDQGRQLADYQLGVMRRNNDRYWDTAVPFEDQLLSDVKRTDSAEYKDSQVRAGQANVGAAFHRAGLEANRTAGRYGLNRVVRSSADLGIEKAKAEADATNKMRLALNQSGLANKMQMYGGMKGLSGLGVANAQAAAGGLGVTNQAASGMMGAGTGFVGANNSAFGSSMQSANSALSNWGQQDNARMQASASESAGMWGAVGTGAGAYMGYLAMASDRRLKENIEFVGVDRKTGLNLYEFNYIGQPEQVRYRGVMADEVEPKYPEAVVEGSDGFKAVNYDALGMRMVQVGGA